LGWKPGLLGWRFLGFIAPPPKQKRLGRGTRLTLSKKKASPTGGTDVFLSHGVTFSCSELLNGERTGVHTPNLNSQVTERESKVMTDQVPQVPTDTISNPELDVSGPIWAEDAPRGGKAVLNRIIKEKATVPLFFGQTLIQSLRDMGYNSTTSALCEHVDNAIQWGATEVHVYFHQTGKRGDYNIDALVLDDGKGMSPNVLKFATSFGGSMVYGRRAGIGRYGMGMKTAALSLSPVMDLYSWQEPKSIYNMTLDVEAIGRERANLIELPEPRLLDVLPSDISDILTKPMVYPDVSDQDLFASDTEELAERLGRSGTLIFMPNCDRLTSATARPLVDHTVKEMSRIYRRFLAKGIKLYVNNRLVQPFDPTYSMAEARHVKIPEITVKHSRLVISKQVMISRTEPKRGDQERALDVVPITVRLYALPIEDWGPLPRKVRSNDLHLYEDHTVSVLRNDREVFIGTIPQIMKRHGDANWLRIQIDFGGELDEAFGLAANKQGVRPKDYVLTAIAKELESEIAAVRDRIKRYQSEQAIIREGSKQSAGELKADEAEGLQTKPIPQPAPTTEEEQKQLDDNLRTLAVLLKRDNEDDEAAFERIKKSRHVIHYKHDEYWPFYHVDQRFGKIILTINTAHAFYTRLYEPLSRAAQALAAKNADAPVADVSGNGADSQTFEAAPTALTALQLLLLSLARTQSSMAWEDVGRKQLFDQFRKEWSDTYQTQLTSA
jgi:hypothetical protein